MELKQVAELKVLRSELEKMSRDINKKMVNTEDKYEERFRKAFRDNLRDVQQTLDGIINGIKYGDDALAEKSQKNLDYLKRQAPKIKKVFESIKRQGADYFKNQGLDMAKKSADEQKDYIAKMQARGADIRDSVLNENALKLAANRSILLYEDFTGRLADEVSSGLMRSILTGTTRSKLIGQYLEIVPDIEKETKQGKPWFMSAETRALMTIRTESIRLWGEVADQTSKKVWGENYYIQNLNPLDERTAPICEAATNAGIMKRDEFMATYGPPGRHPNCRCTTIAIPPFMVEGDPEEVPEEAIEDV